MIRQLLDNTMLAAGLITDPKNFITRVNKLMTHILNNPINGGKIEDSAYIVEAEREETDNKEFNSILKEIKEEEEAEAEKKKKSGIEAEILIDKDGNPQVKN